MARGIDTHLDALAGIGSGEPAITVAQAASSARAVDLDGVVAERVAGDAARPAARHRDADRVLGVRACRRHRDLRRRSRALGRRGHR